VTEREALPDWGFEHAQADPYDDGWFGSEQVALPIYLEDVPTPPRGEPVILVAEERPHELDTAPPPARRASPATVNTWTVNGQLRASDTSTLIFRSPPTPWYRTKQARIALAVVAVAAVVAPIVLLTWPDDASTGPAPSTSIAPQPSTARPALTSAPPAPVNLPPPLPPPPPAPPSPPPDDTGSAPSYDEPYWTRPAPEPTAKPPTPVTRAPISVAPVPRRPPKVDTGDSNKPGCAGWC
jgi:hypothetical protein